MHPRNIGPGGMSGRVTSIDVVNDNPDIIYVGTASGGLWKSTSGGVKWMPIFDNQITASIGAVAIQQSNPVSIFTFHLTLLFIMFSICLIHDLVPRVRGVRTYFPCSETQLGHPVNRQIR